MAIEDKTATFTATIDGTDSEIYSQTVPTGELWYVDSIHCYSDGSGDDTSISAVAGVGPSQYFNALTTGSDYDNNADRGGSANIDTSSAGSAASAQIDTYASAGEDIRVSENADGGTTGSFYVTLIMRRIL